MVDEQGSGVRDKTNDFSMESIFGHLLLRMATLVFFYGKLIDYQILTQGSMFVIEYWESLHVF